MLYYNMQRIGSQHFLPPSRRAADEHFLERFAESSQYWRSYPSNTSLIVGKKSHSYVSILKLELTMMALHSAHSDNQPNSEMDYHKKKKIESKKVMQTHPASLNFYRIANPQVLEFEKQNILKKKKESEDVRVWVVFFFLMGFGGREHLKDTIWVQHGRTSTRAIQYHKKFNICFLKHFMTKLTKCTAPNYSGGIFYQ